MNTPSNLSLRQTIEGMTLTFDAEAAGELAAVIQFNITRSTDAQGRTGDEPGTYYLDIANGACQFHVGAVDTPTLTITTPSDVWLKISRSELSGQDGLMRGLYQANGDLSLLLKMNNLFKAAGDVSYDAPADQRPAGPIPLPGMAWLTVAFVPWIIHWVTFDISGVGAWVSVGLPLLLSILIVGYRKVYDRPTVMEWGGLGFFALAGGLSLLGESGFMVWGSVTSSLVMALLWLGTILLTQMPLSGEYSKWGFVQGLWPNSMFIYPNAVISLMWGWQFIAASLLGVIAILLPEQATLFTVLRYLLLIPAFIFTSIIQKRAMQLRVDDYEAMMTRMRLWAGVGISAISGLLLAATMPGFDVPLLGWIALVPMLMVVMMVPAKQRFFLALPFGLAWSVGVHNWYPHIFPAALGYFLIFAVGAFYAGVLAMGLWLQDRFSGWLKLLALPITWAAVEYIKFIAPVVEDWWFVLLAKSQWRFPPALQILSVTGFPGLSFMVMLANVALAFLLLNRFRNQNSWKHPGFLASSAALATVLIILIWGALTIPAPPDNTFTIAALTDMVNQDPNVLSTSEFASEDFGTAENSPEVSQAIFDVDAALTRSIAAQQPDYVVWPENEFANADDPHFMDQLKGLGMESGSYIVADVVWHAPTGMHDTALMVSPDGEEVGRRAKINTTDGEENVGFVPGPNDYPVFDTLYGKVGLGVCWDRHRLFITRELARNGAQIVLMTVDDNFGGTPWFPPIHASDGVFRAVENRAAFGLGTTNGLSMVIDPYGRIAAEGTANERGVIMGETFTTPGQTLYTRWGDWFGWLLVAGVVVLAGTAVGNKRDKRLETG
jgi:apolipoprotein N-acyltransferase